MVFPQSASEWLAHAEKYDMEILEIEQKIQDAEDRPLLVGSLVALKDALTKNRDQALRFTVKASEDWR
jgi:hypothetical protein